MPILAGVLALATLPAVAAEPMRYIYHPPESQSDVRYLYQWKILKAALDRTEDHYGPYLMEPSLTMTEQRQRYELRNATGKLTVMYLDTSPETERELWPTRIPVDKGLVGYRIFLIRKEDQPAFARIDSLDGLRTCKFGLGVDWIDVRILKADRFPVVTGSSYEGLFAMLVNKRFDVLSRGANEVGDEYDQRKDALPGLWIEQTLCLHYPLPMYFWFSRTPEGRHLAARAEEGMRLMIADGTYDRIFDDYFRDRIARLRLKSRRILTIDNPFLGPETPFQDKRLWFDPRTYRPTP